MLGSHDVKLIKLNLKLIISVVYDLSCQPSKIAHRNSLACSSQLRQFSFRKNMKFNN